MELVNRFDVWLTPLDPALGSEMRKTRPCIVVSPNETNRHLNTIVVVPLTSAEHEYAFRLNFRFLGRDGQAAVDQVRVIDKSRLISKLGTLDKRVGQDILQLLRNYFT